MTARPTPRQALDVSRVDVMAMIDGGIPPREWVPGAEGLLPRAKRTHITAERKSGKSLAFAVVTAVDVVAAGGSVAVLDRENGPDEYARRTAAVLDARGADDAFRKCVRARLAYHAWPALSLHWGEDYPAAFDGTDVVIFDSSRSHLTPLGLKEDQADDFALFTDAVIDPLMQVGITTVTLDNAGHAEKDRARGTSAKEDLCDIAFVMSVLSPFSSTVAGRVELKCSRSRIGELTPGDVWHMALGNGHYGTWQKIGARPPEARNELHDATLEVLRAATNVLGVNKIAKGIRGRPGNTLRFSDRDLRAALDAWAADPASGVLPGPDQKGYTAHGGTVRHDPHGAPRPPRLATDPTATPKTPTATGDHPMANTHATGRHGAHGGSGVSLRDATSRHDPSQNGHNNPPDGELAPEWAEAIAAEFEEASA